jgi:hypothetical protein
VTFPNASGRQPVHAPLTVSGLTELRLSVPEAGKRPPSARRGLTQGRAQTPSEPIAKGDDVLATPSSFRRSYQSGRLSPPSATCRRAPLEWFEPSRSRSVARRRRGSAGSPRTLRSCREARSREASGRGAARRGERGRGSRRSWSRGSNSSGLMARGYAVEPSPCVPVHIHSRMLAHHTATSPHVPVTLLPEVRSWLPTPFPPETQPARSLRPVVPLPRASSARSTSLRRPVLRCGSIPGLPAG